MKFLEELGFDPKIIIEFEKEVPQPIKTKIIDYQAIVSDNIKYLKVKGKISKKVVFNIGELKPYYYKK